MSKAPTWLWHRWQRLGRFMGSVIARVVMTVLYFTVVLPFGVGVRLLGDPLRMKARPKWLTREDRAQTMEDAQRLY